MNRDISLIVTDSDLHYNGKVSLYGIKPDTSELYELVQTLHNPKNAMCVMTLPAMEGMVPMNC